MLREHHQALPRPGVPHAHGAVLGAGRQPLARAVVEMHRLPAQRRHVLLVPQQRLAHAFARQGVPQPDFPVLVGRGKARAVGGPGRAEDVVPVALLGECWWMSGMMVFNGVYFFF